MDCYHVVYARWNFTYLSKGVCSHPTPPQVYCRAEPRPFKALNRARRLYILYIHDWRHLKYCDNVPFDLQTACLFLFMYFVSIFSCLNSMHTEAMPHTEQLLFSIVRASLVRYVTMTVKLKVASSCYTVLVVLFHLCVICKYNTM